MELIVLASLRAGNYVLIAVGFALVFGSLRILNLMHGSFVMLGACGTYLFIAALALGAGSASTSTVAIGGLLLSALVTSLVGWILFKALQLTRRTEPREVLTIAVAGNLFVAQVLQNMVAGHPVPAYHRSSFQREKSGTLYEHRRYSHRPLSDLFNRRLFVGLHIL